MWNQSFYRDVKSLRSFHKNPHEPSLSTNIGEVVALESLAERFSVEAVSSVYRPLKPFLLTLADLYHEKMPCLCCFNEEKGLPYLIVGWEGAPFGKDDTAAAYLVSFLNLLQRDQSYNDNYLLLGANCEDDHPLMKAYTCQLSKEMEEIEGEALATQKIIKLFWNLNSFHQIWSGSHLTPEN